MKGESAVGCVIWLVFGVVSALIAASKGRSAVGMLSRAVARLASLDIRMTNGERHDPPTADGP